MTKRTLDPTLKTILATLAAAILIWLGTQIARIGPLEARVDAHIDEAQRISERVLQDIRDIRNVLIDEFRGPPPPGN